MEDGVPASVVVLASLSGTVSLLLQAGRESGNIPARAYARARWGSGLRRVSVCIYGAKVERTVALGISLRVVSLVEGKFITS